MFDAVLRGRQETALKLLDELIAAIHNDAIRARRIFGLSIEAGGAPVA